MAGPTDLADFEALSNGTTLTSGNISPFSVGGTAPTAATAGAVYGSMGFSTAATAATSFVNRTFTVNNSASIIFAFVCPTAPGSAIDIMVLRNTTVNVANARLSTSNVLTIADFGGTVRVTTAALTPGAKYWVRIGATKGASGTANGTLNFDVTRDSDRVSIGSFSTTTGNAGLDTPNIGRWGKNTGVAATISGDYCGASTGTAALIDIPVLNYAVAGTVAGTSTTVGAITSNLAVTGTTAAASATAGAITSNLIASGTVAGSSGTVGALTSNLAAAGSTAGTSTVSGSLTSNLAVSGTVAATSAAAGALTPETFLAGTVAASSDTSGDLTANLAITGRVDAVSDTTGDMTLDLPYVEFLAFTEAPQQAVAFDEPTDVTYAELSRTITYQEAL